MSVFVDDFCIHQRLSGLAVSHTGFTDIGFQTFLAPFLDVVRSDDTSGYVTYRALLSVQKFILHGLLGECARTCMACIALDGADLERREPRQQRNGNCGRLRRRRRDAREIFRHRSGLGRGGFDDDNAGSTESLAE